MDWSIILSSCIVAATTIIGIFLKELVQNKRQKRNSCIVEYTKKNQNVEKAIRFALNKLDADRVHIYEFHNGDHFYSGSHQQKFSCTYEALSAGVSSEVLNLQDLRVSTFNQFINKIINEFKFEVVDVESLKDSLLKNWLETRGIASSFSYPIRTLNKNVIGIINVDFTKQKDKISKEEEDFIIQQSKIIGGYLI